MSTVTYRPNADGSNKYIPNINPTTPPTHYDKVDEASPDGSTTLVYTLSTSYKLDTYQFANPAETGTIESIAIHTQCANVSNGYTTYGKAAIYTAAQATQYGDENALTGSGTLVDCNKTWASNPWTSAAWSWSDLDALEIGVALKGDGTHYASCTQVYIVITYNTAAQTSQVIIV